MLETLDQNQIIFFVIVMAVAAIPVGFVAGLFGVGGGLITVPVLFYIFDLKFLTTYLPKEVIILLFLI